MSQQVVTLDQAGASQWLWLDSRRFIEQNSSLAVTYDADGNLTYDVELTYDRNSNLRWQRATITRVTTTATVTLVDHGLNTGDNVTVFDTGYTSHTPVPDLEGTFDITVVDKDTFTYTVASGANLNVVSRVVSFRVFDHPDLTAKTSGEAAVQRDPVSGVRLNVTAYTAGQVTLTVLQQG